MEQNEQVTPAKTSALKKYLPGGAVVVVLGLLGFIIFHKPGTGGWTKGTEVQKIDTVLIVAQGPAGAFLDSAIRAVGKTRTFKDSNSLDGQVVEYTAYRPGQLNDTVKDIAGHPVLDSLKRPIIHLSYPPTYTDTSLNQYIKVVIFPKRK